MKDKDRELRGILTWFFERHPGVTVGQAHSKIKALYKPLGKEELMKALFPFFNYVANNAEYPEVILSKIAQAIINARSKNEQR